MTRGPEQVAEIVREQGLSYPVSVERLERDFPFENVNVDNDGNSVTLAELLSETDVGRFEDEAALRRELEPVCENISSARTQGFFGYICDFYNI